MAHKKQVVNNEVDYGYGSTYGADLVGFPDTGAELPYPKTSADVGIPWNPVCAVPIFLSQFKKQVPVMLRPNMVFVAQNQMPDWNPYNVNNNPEKFTALVFQSPLEYIGLPE